jgi:hypothetical protein
MNHCFLLRHLGISLPFELAYVFDPFLKIVFYPVFLYLEGKGALLSSSI